MAEVEEIAEEMKEDTVYTLDDKTLKKLVDGVLAPHLPQLEAAQKQLSELRQQHGILIETVQQENAKFGDCQALTDVTDKMEKAKFYHEKLLKIKKEMHALHDKSGKLKRRAIRLRQEKQREEQERDERRERELERERQLAAVPKASS